MVQRGIDRLAVGLFLAVSITAFETLAVGTVLPTIADEFRGDRLYGATFVAYMVANLIALVAAGERADRTGLARPFAEAGIIFSIGLVVAGVANSMWVVLAGRALQGAGSGVFITLGFAAARRAYNDESQGRMYALLSTGWVLPSLISPFVAGWVTDRFGWRWVFIGMLPLVPVVMLLSVPSLRTLDRSTTLSTERGASRIPTALFLAFGISLITVSSYSARWWWAVLVLAFIGAIIVSRALRNLMPNGMWRARPGRPAAVLARICAMAAFNGADFFIPLAARRIHDASPTEQGAAILGAALTWNAGQWVAVRWGRRVGLDRLVAVGFVILGAGCAASAMVLRASIPLWVTFIVWTIGGLGMGLLFNPTSQVAVGGAEAASAGLAATQVSVADVLGFSIIAAFGGALVSFADQTSLSLRTALIVTFAAATAATVLGGIGGWRIGSGRASGEHSPGDEIRAE